MMALPESPLEFRGVHEKALMGEFFKVAGTDLMERSTNLRARRYPSSSCGIQPRASNSA